METRILVLVSGVDMWKVTPSKSETVWSMLTGGALQHVKHSSGRKCALLTQKTVLLEQIGSKRFDNRGGAF